MKVSRSGSGKSTGSIKKPVGVKKTSPGNSDAFTDALSKVHGTDASGVVESSQGLQAPQAVDALLTLQETDSEGSGTGKKKAIKWGHDALDLLEQLRVDLLLGRVPEVRLKRILALIRTQQAVVTDSGLKSILDDIEIRAAVEMAKLGRFS